MQYADPLSGRAHYFHDHQRGSDLFRSSQKVCAKTQVSIRRFDHSGSEFEQCNGKFAEFLFMILLNMRENYVT